MPPRPLKRGRQVLFVSRQSEPGEYLPHWRRRLAESVNQSHQNLQRLAEIPAQRRSTSAAFDDREMLIQEHAAFLPGHRGGLGRRDLLESHMDADLCLSDAHAGL